MLPIAQSQNTQAAPASTRLLRDFSELAPAGPLEPICPPATA